MIHLRRWSNIELAVHRFTLQTSPADMVTEICSMHVKRKRDTKASAINHLPQVFPLRGARMGGRLGCCRSSKACLRAVGSWSRPNRRRPRCDRPPRDSTDGRLCLERIRVDRAREARGGISMGVEFYVRGRPARDPQFMADLLGDFRADSQLGLASRPSIIQRGCLCISGRVCA